MNTIEQIMYYTDPDRAELWWEKPADALPGAEYQISLDGNAAGRTDKTHFTMEGLESGKEYTASVNGQSVTFTTPLPRTRMDVTAAPWCAKGDGQTMNTAALQKAFDDCPAGGAVYFPAGTYLTGALRLHSDMELYLDEGAVLQG
ncbi:MAG: glycoside hydrolase family 28 protein, partial [Lachnospiraceae bacterium]|nr:glycoside hydrolase family 28 protein [Lachnospiraceae bacterium]